MHRIRLMPDACISVWGADRADLRIWPLNSYNSMLDSDPVGLKGL